MTMKANHASDYRRAFIMLRALQPGWSGHARLERRAVNAGLYFTVNAPEGAGAPEAALAGPENGEVFLHPLGPLRRDLRGQYKLAAQLDPRSVGGRPLEACPWIVVTDGGRLCLAGTQDAARPLDADLLSRAQREADPPAADLPEPGELPEPEPPDAPFAVFPSDADVPEPEAPGDEAPEIPPPKAQEPAAEAPDDVKIYTGSRLRIFTQSPPEPEKSPDPAGTRSAADALGLDITRPWPGAAEGLRHLFAILPPAEPSPADGYTYVAVPRAAGCGYGRCLAGLRAEDGWVTGLRRAVEGRWSPQPPAGLEGYRWVEGRWARDEPVARSAP